MDLGPGYDGPERRAGAPREGWTLWREIYGTILGTMPFVVMLVIWAATVQQRLAVLEIEVTHAKSIAESDRAAARDDQREQNRKLDKILDSVGVLQQQVARDGARVR